MRQQPRPDLPLRLPFSEGQEHGSDGGLGGRASRRAAVKADESLGGPLNDTGLADKIYCSRPAVRHSRSQKPNGRLMAASGVTSVPTCPEASRVLACRLLSFGPGGRPRQFRQTRPPAQRLGFALNWSLYGGTWNGNLARSSPMCALPVVPNSAAPMSYFSVLD
jgi:hypothetical protein